MRRMIVESPAATDRTWPRVAAVLQVVAVVILLGLTTPVRAAAYIDPLSGSIIVQVVAAAGLGAVLSIRRLWTGAGNACRRAWEGLRQRWGS